jgi:hypothetical protein
MRAPLSSAGVQHNEFEPERPCGLVRDRPSKNSMRGFFPLLRVRRKRPSHCAADQLISSWSQIDQLIELHPVTARLDTIAENRFSPRVYAGPSATG